MKHTLKYKSLLLLILVISQVAAQGLEDAIGFEDTIDDTTAAPIHFFIPLAFAVGIVLGIKKLK